MKKVGRPRSSSKKILKFNYYVIILFHHERASKTFHADKCYSVCWVVFTEAPTRGVFCKVFLKLSRNYQENPYARVSFLIKLQASCQQLY